VDAPECGGAQATSVITATTLATRQSFGPHP
jgi:hypothetical protein